MQKALLSGLRRWRARSLTALGLLLATTASHAQTTAYCNTGLGGACGGNDITAVSIAATTLNATGLTCAATGGQAYSTYPASGSTTATLAGGAAYTLSVTLTGSSIVSVWIDYNRNFVFEPAEWTQVSTASPTNAPATVSVLVPANAVQGQTGMRIRSRASGNTNGAGDACLSFGSGETKDFTVTIGAPAACPSVTGLSTSGVTATGATVSFTPGASGTTYTVTATPASGTPITQTATASPVTLTGLTPSTAYTISVVANCGGTNGSSTPATTTLRTNCATPAYVLVNNATPYTQDFETAWLSRCDTNDAPGANWQNTPATGNQSWRRSDDGASAGWTNPTSGAYTPAGSPLGGGTSQFSARFHSYYAPARSTGALDLYVNMAGTAGTPTLNFDYINTSGATTPDSLRVLLSTDGGATFARIAGASVGVQAAWTRRTVALPATGLTATTVIRLQAVSDFGTTDIGVDNVRVSYVTCPAVTGVTITNITPTGATVSFTPGASGATYTVTATPASGTPVAQTATASPVTLTGLTANTVYTVSVVADCGSANGSSTATTATFRSGCTAPAYVAVTSAAPYAQDFEATWLSQCNVNDAPGANWQNTPATGNASWRRHDDGASAGWTSPTLGAYTPTSSTGTYSARFHSYSAGAGATGTLDLYVNLSAAGNKVLQFDYLNTAGNDSLQVQLSTDGGATFGAPLLRLGISGTAAQGWRPQAINVPSASATTVVRFRTKVTSTLTSDIGLDNLRLSILNGVPGCATALSPANGATGVSRTPTLTFASGTGITTGYDVYFGTSATPPLVASNQPGQSYTPGALAANTTYYYQVVPRNADGPATGCGVVSFTTSSTFIYCNTNLGNTCGSADILNVTLANTGFNNTSTCTATNGVAYTSYPATGSATGTLLQGLSYPVSVTTSAAAIVSVWIDFNQNGAFEASEFTQVTTASTANQPATATVLVPANAVLGQTGLRVRTRSQGSPNGPNDACSTFASGETEDYIVTIGPAPACAPPTGLSATSITTTSATLTFGPGNGTATSYTVLYGVTGFNPAQPSSGTNAYTSVTATTPSVPVTGLTPNTTYQFYVTKSCGAGQTSQLAGPFTFRTQCVPPVYATLPYSQDFEATWVDGCGTRDVPSTNWRNTPVTGNTSWRREDDGTSAGWTGPTSGAYSPPGSPLSGATSLHSARFHSYEVTGRGVGTLDLYVNAAGGTGTPTLSFDYINTSGATVPDSLKVQLSTNGGSTFADVANGAVSIASTWTRRTVTLPAGLTATTVIRLRAVGDFGFTDIGLDNVQVAYIACGSVSGLAATTASPTSVSVSFTPVTGATNYTLTLTPANGTPTTQTVTASPVTLTGLTPGTSYSVSVVTNCGGGSGTSQPAVVSFVVPAGNDECAGALNVPVQFGSCVSQTAADNSTATTSTGVPAPSCVASSLNRDIWFKVTVPNSGNLTIRTVAPTGGSNITDTVISLYAGTCGSLTEIGCNDDTNGTYSQLLVSGRTPGEVLYIRAWSYSTSATGLIAVCATTPSNCAAPTGPTATNITSTSAQLNWAVPTNVPAGATYELEYGPQGFNPGGGTTVTGLTTNTYALTSLVANTTYCFYVRTNCGTVNGSSAYVGPTCFTTPLTVPANDNPCGAVTLAGSTVTGSTSGATTSGQPGIPLPTCSSAQLPKDVWFVFTAPATSYRLTITGSAAGLVRVFTTPDCSAGPFNQVFCQAGPGSNQNVGPVVLNGLTTGARYYVAVSGYSSSDTPGSFTILGTVTATKAQADTDALLVYPNPSTTGQLTLRLSGATGAGQATLLNALGQVVRHQALSATAEHTLSTRGLATGLYTLRVTVAGQVLTRKVVLE